MKSTFFKTLAIIIGMMMSISLVSCGDDDDNNEPENTKAVAYYDVKYVTDLNDDWFKFFDVTISYVNGAGEEKTEAIVQDFRCVGEYSNHTIQAVSESVGFKSTSNFVIAFKKVMGVTPSAYQKLACHDPSFD